MKGAKMDDKIEVGGEDEQRNKVERKIKTEDGIMGI